MRLRIGDLVEYRFGSPKLERGLVKATDRAWYVIKDHVDINNCIVAVKDVTRIITLREKLKDWWKWLDHIDRVCRGRTA